MAGVALCQIHVHLVWHTWRRVRCVDRRAAQAVRQGVAGAACRSGVRVLACAVLPDHVDLLVTIGPRARLTDFVERCKGLSSYLANREAAGALRWAGGFYAASVSGADLKAVQRLIVAQRRGRPDPGPPGRGGG